MHYEAICRALARRPTGDETIRSQAELKMGGVFWVLVALGALGLLIHCLRDLADRYSTVGTKVKVFEGTEPEKLFPEITICPTEKLNYSSYESSIQVIDGNICWSKETLKDFFCYLLSMFNLNTANLARGFNVAHMDSLYQRLFNRTVNPKAVNVEAYLESVVFSCESLIAQSVSTSKAIEICKGATLVWKTLGPCWKLNLHA